MLKVVLRFLRRSISHLPRVVPLGALLLLFLGATIVLVLRYSILPDIGRYHGDITAKVGQIIGQPVIIGKIEADWWGYRPRLKFIDVRFLDKNGQTALVLPRVDNVVSWLSLLTGEIRLYSLEIDQPDLLVKRDAQGVVHIAGVAMSGQVAGQTSELDWLLDQSRIAIHDARITWQDELRAAPPLVLTQVELIIENSVLFENLEFIRNSGLIENAGRRHRFALRAQPPVELSSKLDVRGDFDGESFVSLNLWSGQLYTQLDYGDVGTWNEWLTLPVGINSGRGAVRSWLGFEKGKVNQLTADIALEDIQARLAGDLPILDVREVRGRVGWKNITQAKEISTRNLSLLMTDGLQLESTDFFMRLNYAKDGQPPGGEIRTNMLELSKLASLAEFLPLGQEMRQQLTEFSPRGQISGLQLKWQGDASNSLHYEVKGRFNDISLNRVGEFPGFSGLTGQINGNDESGSLSLYSYNMSIDAPNVVVEPLAFDVFNAQFGWRRNERGLEVKFSNVSVANPDLAGNFAGKFQTLSHSPGEIDLTVHLSRVSVRHAYRYIPLVALHGSALAWVRDGFVDGQADEFDLRLQGDMKNFPFDRSDTGVFRIRARAKDVAVEYAQDWPRIENAIAELSIEGRHLKVTSPTAMTAGSNLQNISVVLPDMLGHDLVLQVSGEADDETMRGLDFIQQSPVRGYIDGFTDGATARGKGALRLNLGIPLSGDKPVSVSGNYRFIDSDLDLGRGKPTLTKTNGELLFTESSVRTRNLMAEIFGGPATLEVQTTEDGVMRAKISGRADMEVMRKQESYPLLHYLHGVSPWEAELTVQNKQVNLLLTSNLLGLTSDLPAPFSKRAKEPVSLRFEKKPVDDQKDMLSIKFGSIFTAQLLRHETDGSWDIKRGKVNFGREGKWPTRDGVVITGTIPHLSLEGWGALLSGKRDSASNDKPTAVNIIAIDLLIPKASGYGYKLDDLRISGRKRSEVLIVKLLSSALDGEMRWQPKGGGKLVAHIKNLVLDKDTIEGKQKNDTGKSGVGNERKNDDAFGQAKPAGSVGFAHRGRERKDSGHRYRRGKPHRTTDRSEALQLGAALWQSRQLNQSPRFPWSSARRSQPSRCPHWCRRRLSQ